MFGYHKRWQIRIQNTSKIKVFNFFVHKETAVLVKYQKFLFGKLLFLIFVRNYFHLENVFFGKV